MDPIRRNASPDLNSQAPAPKRQRTDSPEPRSPKCEAMSSAPSEPKLKLQAPHDKKIDFPALVCMMQQHLEIDNNQGQDNTPPAFRKCTLDNISGQDALFIQFQDTLWELVGICMNRKDLTHETKATLDASLGAGSHLSQYINQMEQQKEGSLPTMLGILNTCRQIAKQLANAPAELITKTMEHFPPKQHELLCFDGTLSRVENSLATLEHQQIKLGLKPSNSLLQKLEPTMLSKPQFLLQVLLETANKHQLFDYVEDGMGIHVPNGLQMRMGMNEELILKKDRFAKSATQTIPATEFYNQLVGFQQNLKSLIDTTIESDSVKKSLQEFEGQLESVLEPTEEENPLILGQRLSEIKKNPLAATLANPEEDEIFERLYGEWNDDITQLKGWDWNAINEKLQNTLYQDWQYSNTVVNNSLSSMSYEELAHKNLQPIIKGFVGNDGENEQYHALQLLIAGIENSSVRGNLDSTRTRLWVLQILTSFYRKDFQEEHTKFNHFIHTLTKVCSDNTNAKPNKRLFFSLYKKADKLFSKHFPFNTFGIKSIIESHFKLFTKQPQSIGGFTRLFDLELKPDFLKDSLESSKETIALTTHREQVKDMVHLLAATNGTSGARVPEFFNTLTHNNPKLRRDSLVTAAKEHLQKSNQGVDIALELLSSNLATYFPEILEFDEIYEAHPPLADKAMQLVIHNNYERLFDHLMCSPKARASLLSSPHNVDTSYATQAEQTCMFNCNPSLAAKIDQLPWPAHHYLNQDGLVAPSKLMDTLIANNNADRFTQLFNKLKTLRPAARFDLMNHGIIATFKNAMTHPQIKFFHQICNNLDAGDKQLLSKARGALFDIALQHNTEYRDTLFATLCRTLPKESVVPLVSLMYLYTMGDRSNNKSRLNSAIRTLSISPQLLEFAYPPCNTRKAAFSSLVLAGATLDSTREFGHVFAPENLIGQEIHYYNQDSNEFLSAFTGGTLREQCTRAYKQIKPIVRQFLGLLEERQLREVKEALLRQDTDFIQSLDRDVTAVIYSKIRPKTVLNDQLRTKLSESWDFRKLGREWVAQAKP